jgi:hypothetical protein
MRITGANVKIALTACRLVARHLDFWDITER